MRAGVPGVRDVSGWSGVKVPVTTRYCMRPGVPGCARVCWPLLNARGCVWCA